MRTSPRQLLNRVRTLCAREDFRANPAKAVVKRCYYRARWRFTDSPWSLSFLGDMKIDVPKCGGGALIFYQGASERPLKDFLSGYLQRGMTVVDIGAHFGEYTLLASRLVGQAGMGHAFEPAPMMYDFLRKNVERNKLGNVRIYRTAVADTNGEIAFAVSREPSLSRIRMGARAGGENTSQEIVVACTRLDTWWSEAAPPIDLIKVDVEGAELLVLRGAEGLLARSGVEAPAVIFEYQPHNWSTLDCRIEEAIGLLASHGYRLWSFSREDGIFPVDPGMALEACRLFSNNLLALKPEHLAREALMTRSLSLWKGGPGCPGSLNGNGRHARG